MPTWSNNGKYLLFRALFFNSVPSKFYMALITNDQIPGPDNNDLDYLTEVYPGNGYTEGGQEISSGSSSFDYCGINNATDKAVVQLVDIVFTATGEGIPVTGKGAYYAVLCVLGDYSSDRHTICWWDLETERTADAGQQIVLKDLTMELIN